MHAFLHDHFNDCHYNSIGSPISNLLHQAMILLPFDPHWMRLLWATTLYIIFHIQHERKFALLNCSCIGSLDLSPWIISATTTDIMVFGEGVRVVRLLMCSGRVGDSMRRYNASGPRTGTAALLAEVRTRTVKVVCALWSKRQPKADKTDMSAALRIFLLTSFYTAGSS